MKIEVPERDLPPAMLLLGPDLEQMVSTALRSAQRQGAVMADVRVSRHDMTAAAARDMVRFVRTAPFGPFKAVIALLDGASAQAQNIMLKVLEEPPPTVRFILVATSRPLPTIVSRCQVITVPGEAASPEAGQKVTAQVAAALTAASADDLRGLDMALAGWDVEQHAALQSQLAEAATGDAPHGLNQVQARRLLGVLGRFSGAHPRLAAHAALISVLSDKEKHD